MIRNALKIGLAALFAIIVAVPVFGQSIPTISPWMYFGGGTRNIRPVATTTKILIGASATTTASFLETPSAAITGLTSEDCVGTDSAGNLISGTCGSGSGGIATSGPIADTEVIYGTAADTVDSEPAFTYDDSTNLLTVDNASTTLFSAVTGFFTNVFIGLDTLAEYISDTAGAMWSGNTETGGTITYQDADNTLDFVCDTASSSTFGCLLATDFASFDGKLSTSTAEATYLSLSAWYATTTDGLDQGSTNLYNQTHTGEVTGATSLTITNNIVDEANLKIDTTPTDDYILVASSTASGGLAWVSCATVTGSADLCDGDDAAGSGGSGSVATSTSETMTYIPFWTSTAGTPATLGSDADFVFATSTTRLGIGTSSPQVMAHLYSGTAAPYLRLQGVSDGDNVSGLELWNDDAAPKKWQFVQKANGDFTFNHNDGAGWSAPFTIEDDDDILIGSNSLNWNAGGTSGSNYKISQTADDFLNLQRSGGTDTNYTLIQINAPAANPTEATLALMRDSGSGNYNFVDLYNQDYTSETQWGLRQRKAGTEIFTPFVLDYFDGSVKTPQLVILPSGNVGIGMATSSVDTDSKVHIASTTATNLLRLDGSSTSRFVVANNGDTTIQGALTLGTALGIANGGLNAAFTDPNADQLMFWDDTAGAITGIGTLSGAAISGTTLTINDVTCTDCLNATEIEDIYLLLAGDSSSGNYVWSGQNDFGGATFLEIPNGTAPTANDPGELAHDTTDNQLILDDFVVAKATQKIWSVTVASTSRAFIDGGLMPVPTELDGYTMTAIRCKVDAGTSKVVAIEDASANSTEDITCTTSVTSDDGSITNAAATAAEEMYIDFGATSGAVDYVTISVFGTWTRE